MQAVIFDAPGQARVTEWQTPEAGVDSVVVSVAATGICAGDMYIYSGKNPYSSYPIIGGHEIAGSIYSVGSKVTDLTEGMRVVIEPFLGCGHCYACRAGKSNCCTNLQIIGVHRAGGFAEFVVAPKTHVHRIPDSLTMTMASFTEPLAIGLQACRRAEVRSGEYVLILGCGPIGLALIEIVKARGAHPVVVDVQETRLDMARHLGAEVIHGGSDILTAVLEQTNGEGAPVVIEATGNVQVMESTVNLVAAGGRIVIVGLLKRGVDLALPGLDITRKEMTILGSRASVDCFPESIEILASGQITYPKVAEEFDMWDAPAVFAKIAANPAAIHKAVLMRA